MATLVQQLTNVVNIIDTVTGQIQTPLSIMCVAVPHRKGGAYDDYVQIMDAYGKPAANIQFISGTTEVQDDGGAAAPFVGTLDAFVDKLNNEYFVLNVTSSPPVGTTDVNVVSSTPQLALESTQLEIRDNTQTTETTPFFDLASVTAGPFLPYPRQLVQFSVVTASGAFGPVAISITANNASEVVSILNAAQSFVVFELKQNEEIWVLPGTVTDFGQTIDTDQISIFTDVPGFSNWNYSSGAFGTNAIFFGDRVSDSIANIAQDIEDKISVKNIGYELDLSADDGGEWLGFPFTFQGAMGVRFNVGGDVFDFPSTETIDDILDFIEELNNIQNLVVFSYYYVAGTPDAVRVIMNDGTINVDDIDSIVLDTSVEEFTYTAPFTQVGTPTAVIDEVNLSLKTLSAYIKGKSLSVTLLRPTDATGSPISAGASYISVFNAGGSDGIFGGITLKSGESIDFPTNLNQTLPSLAYDATGTEFIIQIHS